MLAICTCTRSLETWRSLADTSLQTLLILSIKRTITAKGLERWNIRLYLGIDHDDAFWQEHHEGFEHPSWLTIDRGFHETPTNKIPFNEMMQHAYEDGAEYLVRINDDTEFVTSEWITRAVEALRAYDPPNVGVVGPICKQGNTAIMTHAWCTAPTWRSLKTTTRRFSRRGGSMIGSPRCMSLGEASS